MKSFLPRSLFSQIALVMTAALLIASAVNFALLLGERSRAGLIEMSGGPIARFVDIAAEVMADPPAQGEPLRRGRPQFGGRLNVADNSLASRPAYRRNIRLEQRLARAFETAGVEVGAVQASTRQLKMEWGRRSDGTAGRPMGRDDDRFDDRGPGMRVLRPGANDDDDGDRPPPMAVGGPMPKQEVRVREMAFSARMPDGRWINAAFFAPQPPDGEIYRLGASTFVLFVGVLGAALWVAARLSRPLKDLTEAAARVGAAAEPEAVRVSGPTDVRQTLEAFNAMSQRVSQLLGEKDVMLGALGHDLRTPLASLRIRLESMEPEAERQKAIRTIEETTLLLEDILSLARQGRSAEAVQNMDVAILVEDIVEDYAETGAPVSLAASVRAPIACRPVLFGRLMRNLIDNAVAYGGVARVSVARLDGQVEIRVEDDGPGMSPEVLATATRPFVRGEDSRNRGTGGSGLGLALADAIAKAHGGALILSNRAPHGLTAAVRLPAVAS